MLKLLQLLSLASVSWSLACTPAVEGPGVADDGEGDAGEGEGEGDQGEGEGEGEGEGDVGACGDAVVGGSIEECDDGNQEADDGCDPDCVRSGAVNLALGAIHSCALLRSGAIRCWGGNYSGQLGYSGRLDVGQVDVPADAGSVDVGGPAIAIAAGSDNTCAVLSPASVRCWGAPAALGTPSTDPIGDDEAPASIAPLVLDDGIAEVALDGISGARVCAVSLNGNLRCWGSGGRGALGYGTLVFQIDDIALAGDVDVGGVVVSVALEQSAVTCALLDNGDVRCWGVQGLLGVPTAEDIGDDETPTSIPPLDLGGPALQVAAGGGHACAILEGGRVRCWGDGQFGQLGYGNTNVIGDDEAPASAGDVNVGGAVKKLALGTYHTCALLESGAVRCWGFGDAGVLGYASTEGIGDDETPASAGDVNVGGLVLDVEAGTNHTCAILEGGRVRCWGDAAFGRLGYGDTNSVLVPAEAGDVALF